MKKKLGIVGVIILTIIILIISSITYTYVESIRIKPVNEISEYIEGFILEILKDDIISYHEKEYQVYEVKLRYQENETLTYDMFFYNLYPPLEKLNIRFYYDLIETNTKSIYRIVRIEII